MRMADKGGRTARRNKLKRDNRGSAIVIVIIAMAMIGILATTILWASYLNYRIKISDLKVKNSFYSAETVVEQIMAGVKKDVVSASVNEAYQEVVSNWDALGTDANRESYFITAYTQAVEEKLGVGDPGVPAGQYDPAKLAATSLRRRTARPTAARRTGCLHGRVRLTRRRPRSSDPLRITAHRIPNRVQ